MKNLNLIKKLYSYFFHFVFCCVFYFHRYFPFSFGVASLTKIVIFSSNLKKMCLIFVSTEKNSKENVNKLR